MTQILEKRVDSVEKRGLPSGGLSPVDIHQERSREKTGVKRRPHRMAVSADEAGGVGDREA